MKKGYLGRSPQGKVQVLRAASGDEASEKTTEIALVGTAPCGQPLLAVENIEAMYPVSQKLARPGADYFLLRAIGNSMNNAEIYDGDIVLVRQQPVAQNGDRVVALINDEATIKEFQRQGDKILLLPRSSDPIFQPIILDQDFIVLGIVIDRIQKEQS